jgi:hypothetical protein
MRSLAAVCSLTLLIAAPVLAQDENARRIATELDARVPLEKAVIGAPYSADVIVESTQTLADGTHIARKTTSKVYRDGEGRVRREDVREFETHTDRGPLGKPTATVSIVDPVAGYSYALDPEHRVAWRTPLGASGAIFGSVEAQQKAAREREMVIAARGRSGGEPRRGESIEPQRGGGNVEAVRKRGMAIEGEPAPLEHKTLEGLQVDGRKRTTVLPVGAVGNDQPLTITSEEWTSRELKVLVFTHHADPRTGESTYRLTNIVRAEPDKSLFIVPPDYTVRDTGIRRNN